MPERAGVDPTIATARRRWTQCHEAEDQQRQSILTAKQFRAGNQWPTAIKLAREGAASIQGQAPQPPRPCLVVDRLSPQVRLISNQIRNSEFGFDVLPNGDGADEDVAEILKGCLRRIQVNARNAGPIEWAADQAIEGGIGWFRGRTAFVSQTPPSGTQPPADPAALFDQEILLERIANNLSVYCDPHALSPTKRDARFMFVTEDLAKDDFRQQYPKADLRGIEDFMATGDAQSQMQGWVTPDTIRIAEYWAVEIEEQAWAWLKTGQLVPLDKKVDEKQIQRQRVFRVPKVRMAKISAVEVLEQYDWPGLRIPLWPILGEELNVDGKTIVRGLIQEGEDAQRMVNYAYSGGVEMFALAPRTPFVAAAGQIEQYKSIWQNLNTYNFAYAPYDPVSIGGSLAPPPQQPQTDVGPKLQAAIMLMQTSEEAIKATTNIQDASLGAYNPQAHSGKAIQALQTQSQLASSNFADAVKRTLIDCAQELVYVLPRITRPGQIVQILQADDKPSQVMVGKPFQQQNGQPVAAGPEITPAMTKLQGSLHKFYDLTAGTYTVTVAVSRAHATKREEGAAALGDLIPHLPPQQMMVVLPDYVEQLSFPGAHGIAEQLRRTLPPGLQQQDGEEQTVPMATFQAAMQQGSQQIQQLQQMIQQKQIEQQADLQKAEIDARTRIEVARIQAQTGVTEASIKANLDKTAQQIEILQAMIDAQKEARLAAADQAHEQTMQARDHVHDHAMAQHEAQQAAAQRQHETQQTILKPSSNGPGR